VKDQSTIKLHLIASPITTWSDRTSITRIRNEMRDCEKIRTVGLPRTWIIDLSSISELCLSRLGVTRISIEGTVRCEILMRSGPLIHQDHEPSIRVDEDHKFAAKVRNG
jgi:hypothetical protein